MMNEEISWLKKKVENLAASIVNLQNIDDVNTSNIKPVQIDTGNYVQLKIFNEFKNFSIKEFENHGNKLESLQNQIDEINVILKLKAFDKDMKKQEEFLLAKLEELKIACNKKFADKNETAKSLKYLELQIKSLLELSGKKIDKGDNWLLAKKPVNGYSCASCESYIGELHDNMDYIAWNKYPARDGNEKLYRVISY